MDESDTADVAADKAKTPGRPWESRDWSRATQTRARASGHLTVLTSVGHGSARRPGSRRALPCSGGGGLLPESCLQHEADEEKPGGTERKELDQQHGQP